MISTIVYRLRRLGWAVVSPESACAAWRCPKPRLGISVWCRVHTDEILDDRQSAAVHLGLARLRGERPRNVIPIVRAETPPYDWEREGI